MTSNPAFPTSTLWVADEGIIDLGTRHFVGAFGEMKIPDDVWKRGCRLELRGLRQRYSYMAAWCAYTLRKAWEAGRVSSKVDGNRAAHG